MTGSIWARMIRDAHAVYRDSIGTLNEGPSYAFLCAVVARCRDATAVDEAPCAGRCDENLPFDQLGTTRAA